MFEMMWFFRNQIWKGSPPPNWSHISEVVARSTTSHGKAAAQRQLSRRSQFLTSFQKHWLPPNHGRLKFNFAAAFKDGYATTGVILRNEHGCVLGAWSYTFKSTNAYCAETEAALQAFKIAQHMGLKEALFEGDAANPILALQGLTAFDDWQAFASLSTGRNLFSMHNLWFLNYCPRACNQCAHNLAKWAASTSFSGNIPLACLPLSVLEADVLS